MDDTPQPEQQPVKVDRRKRPMSEEARRKLSIAMRKVQARKKQERQTNSKALSKAEQPVAEALSHAGNVSSEELRYISYAVERLECPVTVEVIAAIIDLSVAVHAAMRARAKKEAHHGP